MSYCPLNVFSLIQFIYMVPNHNHSLLNVLYIVGGWLKIAAFSIHLICVTYLGSDHGGSSLSRDTWTYHPPRPSLPGENQGIPEPVEISNLSSAPWVYLGASSQYKMLETPNLGGTHLVSQSCLIVQRTPPD